MFAALTAFNAAGNAGSMTIATAYFTALANPGGARVQLAPTNAHDVGGENLLPLLQLRALDVCVLTQGKWGDASGDGTINIIDAQQLGRFSVALSVANPTAVMLAGVMLLEHIGERTAADKLVSAIREAIASKEAVTPDLGGSATTRMFTSAVLKRLK